MHGIPLAASRLRLRVGMTRRGYGRNGQEDKLDMAQINHLSVDQRCQQGPGRGARLWIVLPLLAAGLFAGCATKALHPATGISDPKAASGRAKAGTDTGRDSPLSTRPGQTAGGATRTDGSSAGGNDGGGAPGASADGNGAGARNSGGAAGRSEGGNGANALSSGDEGGAGGAGARGADGASAAKGGGAAGGRPGGGGDANNAGGANDGSVTSDASNAGGRTRNGGAGGANGANNDGGAGGAAGGAAGRGARNGGAGGAQSGDGSGADGQSAAGAVGGARAGGNAAGAGGGSDAALGAGGNNANGANGANGANAANANGANGAGGGAGGANTGGAEGRDGTGAGVGVGAGEADADNRIAAIEVPNKNVKVDEEFKPQTLGGMLPLVLGVNEEGRFDFDQYALRQEVKGVLDDLADKLKSAEYDRLDIVGYTDRIGTRDYNKRLSELRAWSVAQYLIQKGVPENKVFYEGRGDKDPVTRSDECTGLARSDLITCLQKDRRVEIEASIRRKHATVVQ
jgi:outer membrane protein OmpA-like peptidoglycan-associated protein